MAAKPKIVENSNKLKESAVQIKDSAAHMEHSTARVEDSADRRTELAADRTVSAAERTYAAWVRTGLVAMASGIGAKALLIDLLPHWLVMTSGSVFVLFSVFCFGAGVWRHLSWATAAGARCGPHTSGDTSPRQQHSWDSFDRSADRHLARPRLADHTGTFCPTVSLHAGCRRPRIPHGLPLPPPVIAPEGAGLSPPQRATLSPPQQGLSFFDLQLVQKSHTAWQ